ncbi:MAG: hypothetical protein ACQEV7_03270 [Bacillota bacterium]
MMKTDHHSRFAKVSIDLYTEQMKWAFWFIPIVFIAYLTVNHFVTDVNELNLSFSSFIYQPAKIFMLICGIMMSFIFFNLYVKNGVTRKDVLGGASLAGVGLSFTITIISAILTTILKLIGSWTDYTPQTKQLEFFGTNSLLMHIFIISLIILAYYVSGLIISFGFYKYGGLGGLISIAFAIAYMSLVDLFWEGELTHPLAESLNIPFPELSVLVSILGTILLVAGGLLVLRRVTKKVRIKLK